MILAVHIQTASADLRELETLTRELRRELLLLEVDDVALGRGNYTPEGAKGDAIAIGSLVVTLANSAVLVAVCQVLRAWVTRHRGRQAEMALKDERPVSLKIVGATPAQHQQLIDAFLASVQSREEAED